MAGTQCLRILTICSSWKISNKRLNGTNRSLENLLNSDMVILMILGHLNEEFWLKKYIENEKENLLSQMPPNQRKFLCKLRESWFISKLFCSTFHIIFLRGLFFLRISAFFWLICLQNLKTGLLFQISISKKSALANKTLFSMTKSFDPFFIPSHNFEWKTSKDEFYKRFSRIF